MIYKKRLIELRDNKFMKQYELANILKISKTAYNQYETEYVIIPIKYLIKICDFFNVSIDYIFGFTNNLNYFNNKEGIETKLAKERLKTWRKDNKITQEALAKSLNISRTTIAEYERGKNIIGTPFLYTICKKYNISADYLLGRTDNLKY